VTYTTFILLKGGDPTAGSPTVTLLRLHPSRYSTVVGSSLSFPASGEINSHGVTGGEYKTRERIHRT